MRELWNEGHIVVSAAGNEGNTVKYYPASFDDVISVGGVDENLNRGSYSNTNDGVTVVAPGTRILSTVPDGGYTSVQGTSMACPFVTAAIAKAWAARPQCTNAQVRQALEQSALDLGVSGRDNEYGYGLVQVEAMYNYLLAQPAPCGGPATQGGGGNAPGLGGFNSVATTTRLDSSQRPANPATKGNEFKVGNGSASRGNRNYGRHLKGSRPEP